MVHHVTCNQFVSFGFINSIFLSLKWILLFFEINSYVYNFIDHTSNWSFKYAYPAINARNTKDFMERVIAECPFWIFRLQTDNGVEFTNKYISVSDDPKEHQGLVERSLIYHSQKNEITNVTRKTGEVIDILSSNFSHKNNIKSNEEFSKIIGENDEEKVKLVA